MKLSEVFKAEELSDADKVSAIAQIVDKARQAYGNQDLEVPAKEVNTCEGLQDLCMLDNDSKLAIAESEIRSIKVAATELVKAIPGTVLDRTIETLIATNNVLVNLTDSVESDYL